MYQGDLQWSIITNSNRTPVNDQGSYIEVQIDRAAYLVAYFVN